MMNIEKILNDLPSSHIIKGDATHAYRDPAAILKDGLLHIFMTLVETEEDGGVYMYLAATETEDLQHFTPIRRLTVRDRSKNFSSPGNIVRWEDRYIMCLQSYCRENGEKYGNEGCRIYFSESTDLYEWSEPYPVMLKGDTPVSELGRMIDPYLIYDKKTELWSCFYKQSGVSRSVSRELRRFEYRGHIDGGENVSVVEADGGDYMLHSPKNGIGLKFSKDLEQWEDVGELLTLGQSEWEWARGRITAGTVVKLGEVYLMLFHGTGPKDEETVFDTHAGIGVAWSYDMKRWHWK